MQTVLAGDLGGTKCRFALVSADFGVHRVQHVATVRERAPFLHEFDRAIAAVLADLPPGLERPTTAAFGTAGVIPVHGRSIDKAPNLPLDGYQLAEHVEQRFSLRTTLLNDGRASAWGEFLRGHAVQRDPLLCLFFGTGIGIGLIVGGRPYQGATNAAGEIGHTVFLPGGRRCPCGALGHLEAYCGGRAITERAAAEVGQAPESSWTVGAVVHAADQGNGAARAILADAESAACTLVQNACTLLNPSAVVLGGGVLSGWPALRDRIVDHVRRCTSPLIHQDLLFVDSLGGSDAILWGAAAATGSLWPASR
ncbi:MAG: ROK family protein [Planctomycetota bacterium]|nr:ROK family protein [Planctomycetota bacterium]